MSKRRPRDAGLLRLAAAGFAATAVVGYTATHTHGAYEADHRVRRVMRRRSTRKGDRVATALSLLGEPSIQLPVSIGLSAWMARQQRTRAIDPLNFSPTAAVLASIGAHHAIKELFPRPRPLSARLSGKSEPSYPSGHTTTMTALALSSAMMATKPGRHSRSLPKSIRRSLLGGAIAGPALVAAARVYGGRHWATDVVGGTALGIAIAASTRWLLSWNDTT